jgi:phosphoglycolate phosphatase
MSSRFFLFDLDGTLVDSAPDIARALNATLDEAGLPKLSAAEVTSYVGDGAQKLIERSLPAKVEAPVDVPALVERFKRHYAASICVDSRAYPGVLPTLATLAKRGVHLAVLTNKSGDLARALLGALGMAALIADLVGDGDGFPRKPAPDGALAMLARAAVEPERAWVIGDGLPDLRLARALGCRVAAVAWGYTPRPILAAQSPNRILDRPEELLTLVERPTLAP